MHRKGIEGMWIKAIIVTALLFGFTLQPASAVVLFLDTGGSISGVQGGPLDNTNPVLEVTPGGTATLYVWAIPDADNNKVIAALGHDIVISGPAAEWVSATAYTLDNPTVGGNPRWGGTNLFGGLNAPGKLVDDQRAVFVPTIAPFVGGIGSANLAIDPGHDFASGAVYVGQLDLQIDAGAVLGTRAELRLAVSPLLITHTTTGVWQAEAVSFGYVTCAGTEPATAGGSVVGATSLTADAILSIGPADFADVDGDGNVDLTDYASFAPCIGGPDSPQAGACPAGVNADTDGDCDVDLEDFANLAESFSP